MKTETRRMRTWWVGAMLLWLAFAPMAQAFYNPSTGKWLSRDPMLDEKGFDRRPLPGYLSPVALLLPYTFNRNSPLALYDVLGLWETLDGPPPAELNTIVCKGGKAVPRLAPDTDQNSKCVNGCIRIHEQVHADEANAQGVCTGKDDGLGIKASSPAERVRSEIAAYEKELKCLNKFKPIAIPPVDGKYPKDCPCRLGNVNSHIIEVEKRLAGWKKANPDDTKTWPEK